VRGDATGQRGGNGRVDRLQEGGFLPLLFLDLDRERGRFRRTPLQWRVGDRQLFALTLARGGRLAGGSGAGSVSTARLVIYMVGKVRCPSK
jgi:hypothetical protein